MYYTDHAGLLPIKEKTKECSQMYTYQSMLAVQDDRAVMATVDHTLELYENHAAEKGLASFEALALKQQYDTAVAELTRRCEILGILNHPSPRV
jgi:hypothetical protein